MLKGSHWIPFVVGLLAVWPSDTSWAQNPLQLAGIFADGMVLQQQQPLRVWGRAQAQSQVQLTLAVDGTDGEVLQVHRTVASEEGEWLVELSAMDGDYQPKTLFVQSAEQTVRIRDVLIGEVWLCSGQSNMAWGLNGDVDWDLEQISADYPAIRVAGFQSWDRQPQDDLAARPRWIPMTRANAELGRTSGVGYYFAVALHRYLNVPVGIIDNSVGGTLAESWTSRSTLESIPQLHGFLTYFDQAVAGWPQEMQRRIDEHQRRTALETAEGKPAPRGPDLQPPTEDRNQPAGCYNGMISPISRVALRGVLFFQGENNSIGRWDDYRSCFPAMIRDWREAFDQPELPFGIISLYGFNQPQRDRQAEHDALPPGLFWYSAIRDVHFQAYKTVPGTGLIVTFDVGDSDNIHPHRKQTVGRRAARWALARVYGKPVVHTGPIYRQMAVEDNRIKLYFDLDPLADGDGPWHVSCPITRHGEYRGFVIAGQDRHFFPATAKRLDDQRAIEVSSPLVPDPVAVRYGWSNYPDANMIGIAHLPAHPFRTDNWPLVTQPPYDPSQREAWNAQLEQLKQRADRWMLQRQLQEMALQIEGLQHPLSQLGPGADAAGHAIDVSELAAQMRALAQAAVSPQPEAGPPREQQPPSQEKR